MKAKEGPKLKGPEAIDEDRVVGKPAGAGSGGFCELDGKIYYVRGGGEVAEDLLRGST